MKNILYILFLIPFIVLSQVNVWTYDTNPNDGVISQTELQTALDNENNLIIDPLTSITITSPIDIDQNSRPVQTIDFNGSTIEKTHTYDFAMKVNKPNTANTLTTIKNLDLDGNNTFGSILSLASRVHLQNVEVHHAYEDNGVGGPRGIWIKTANTPGYIGEWLFENVTVHDIVNGYRSADNGWVLGQSMDGWAQGVEIVWTTLVDTGGTGMQFVWVGGSVYNIWGDEACGIQPSAANVDLSFTNNSLWFENLTIYNCERRTVKNYIGNTTWINSTFQAVDQTNPNIDTRTPPAGLFNIGARSSTLGSNNNLICGCTFLAAPGDYGTGAFDAWETMVGMQAAGLDGSANNGVGVQFRHNIFESGDDGPSGYNNSWGAGIKVSGDVTEFKMCDCTVGVASTLSRGLLISTSSTSGRPFNLLGGAKLEIDTNNSYVDGNTQNNFIQQLNASWYNLSDQSLDCPVCPTYGLTTSVSGVTTLPTFDKMEIAETRQLYEFVSPEGATDQTGVWSTSNGAVATVSTSGLVTGVGVGSCTITFTTTDGSFTDTTTITVEASSTEDSIAILNPQGYYDGTSGDIDSWDDISGFELHGTEVGTITFTDQATFDGSSYYDLPVSQFLDYRPTTDEFTVIFREGDTAPTTRGYAISKRGLSNDLEYGVLAYNSGNLQNYYIGGSADTAEGAELNNNRLVITIVETNQVNVWVDGVQVITNSTAIGSETYSGSANIGGRTDGSYLMNNGAQLDLVAIVPKAISVAERQAIETEFQVNGTPAESAAVQPSGFNYTAPYFYLNGTTKKPVKN